VADAPPVPQPRRIFTQKLIQYVHTVRLFTRDYPELNRLIEGYESNDRLIAWAILDALDLISNTPPWTGRYTVENFPFPHLLIRMATINLLESVGILMTRNHLPFSDGGIQVGISSKTPMIQSWIGLLKASTDRTLKEWKIAKNIDAAWDGGVHSDYWYINGYYGA
jgi:hypothetical protein